MLEARNVTVKRGVKALVADASLDVAVSGEEPLSDSRGLVGDDGREAEAFDSRGFGDAG